MLCIRLYQIQSNQISIKDKTVNHRSRGYGMNINELLTESLDNISSIVTAIAAILTAVATFFLWRVTKLLAAETKRMVDASVQPHVVVTLEPNMWAAFHFDINISNVGNAAAYDIEINFDPPLINAKHRKQRAIPFNKVSVLKNGQSLISNICEYEQLKDKVFKVTVSWTKKVGDSSRQVHEYNYDMSSFDGVSYLGARNPLTQIAEQIKKIREDWQYIASGGKRLKTDVYTEDDRELKRKRDHDYVEEVRAKKEVAKGTQEGGEES